MKYKVGDKVRVRRDLVVGKIYGGLDCLQGHKKECGKIFTIMGSEGRDYQLNGSIFLWSEEMLEEVDEMEKGIAIVVDGNKTVASMDGKFGEAKCSPDDEFDVFVGAKLALERLEKQCKPYAWLKKGMCYYTPDVEQKNLFNWFKYVECDFDERMKERGLVFKTEEEAIAVAKKMLAVLKEAQDDD